MPTVPSRTCRALVPILAGASLLALSLTNSIARAAPSTSSNSLHRPGTEAQLRRHGVLAASALPLLRGLLRASFPMGPVVDLQLTKTGPGTVLPGTIITYSLIYANAGDLEAGGTVVTDSLPAGLGFVAADPLPDEGVPAGSGTITWSLGTLSPGASGKLIVTATVQSQLVAGTIIANSAVIASDGVDADQQDNTAQAASEIILADLVLVKTGPQSAGPGQTLTYTLRYANQGTAPAEDVILTDTLPLELGGALVVHYLGTLLPGLETTLEITAAVPQDLADGTVLTNTAELHTSTPEVDLANNLATAGSVVRFADVRVVKSAPASVYPAGDLTYTLSYTNAGAIPAQAVRITDTLPASVTLFEATPPPTQGAGKTWIWDLGTIDPGASGSIRIVASVPSPLHPGDRITNTASIGSATPDLDPANSSFQAGSLVIPGPPTVLTVEVGSTQLEVGGKTTPLVVTVGDAWGNPVRDDTRVDFYVLAGSKVTVNPSFRLTRNGLATATVTSLTGSGSGTILVAAGSLSRSVTISVVPGPPDAVMLTASQAQRTVGQTATIYASVADPYGNQVADGTQVVFTTTLGTLDPTAGNTVGGIASTVLTSTRSGLATVTSSAGSASDLISVQFNPGPPANLGGEASPSTIPIEDGKSNIRISVADQYANSVRNGTIVKFQTGLGTVSPAQSTTTNGVVSTTLAAGSQYGTAVVTATVDSLSITVPVTIQPADLRLVKTASDSPFGTVYVPDQPVTFTLSYANQSVATARSVLITDVVPSQLVSVTWSAPSGAALVSTEPLAWDVGTLAPGAAGTILVRGKIHPDFTGTLINSASGSTTTAERDRANNSSEAAVTVALGDVAILKRLDSIGTNPNPGGTLRYTINYLSFGPAPAVGVRITDTIPEFTSYQWDDRTFAPGLSAPVVNGREIVWVQEGDISGNAQFRLWLNVDPDAPGGFLATNHISIGMLTPESALTLGDNESSDAGARIAGVNVSVFQSGLFQVKPDRLITYTVTYLNNGTVPAEGVVLSDTLPEGVTFLSETSNPPVELSAGDERQRVWRLGTLPADPLGTTLRTIRVVARVPGTIPAGTILDNVASATTTTPESHVADNTYAFLTTVIADEPNSLVVAAGNDRLAVGGATTKIQATVRDRFGNPAGPTSVGFAAAGGTVSPAAATTQGGIATTTFSSGPLVGTATITASVAGLSSSTSLELDPGPAYTLTLIPQPGQLVANGATTSTIRITVADEFGNLVGPTRLDLSADHGTISPPWTETVGGRAGAVFTSGTLVGTATVTATGGSRVGMARLDLTGGPAESVAVNVSPRLLPADGSTQADITVTAFDANGNPVRDGTSVAFSSTLGIISPTIGTTYGGIATATIRGDTRAGRATITATVDSAQASTSISFTPGPPAAIALTADPPTIEADAVSTATISAAVSDMYFNPVGDGVPVVFTTTLGTLSPLGSYTRDGTGVARSVLTSAPAAGTALVTATVRVDGVTVFRSIQVPMSAGLPARLLVMLNPVILTADGVSTATVTIALSDSSGNPNHNIPVRLTASGGTVVPSLVTTTVGSALSVFRAGTLAGTAVVTATTGLLTQTAKISLIPGSPASLTLAANPPALTVGASQAQVSGQVLDTFGNAVRDGTLVSVTATLGEVTSPVTTTRGGYQTTLSAGTRSGTARITARSGTASGYFDVNVKPDTPAAVTVTANPAQIFADGVSTATVTAGVSDQYGNPVQNNMPVLLTVSRGRIDPAVALTQGGVAQAVYSAGTQTGHVSIFASAGMIDGSGGIDLLPGPPSVISLTADPAVLTVGANQAILRGQAADRYSNTVADGTSVVLTTTLGQVTSPVVTADGRFQALLTAGTRAGNAQVSARSGAANTRLDVPIHPGSTRFVGVLAVPAELTADGTTTATLTITATDEYTNPVADDKPVALAASGGSVFPTATVLRSGRATGTFRSGTLVGTATISATVEGRLAVTPIRLVPGAPFSVTLLVEPVELAVGRNEQASIRVGVTDRFANPVANGTPVSVTSTLGTLIMDMPTTYGGAVSGTLTAGNTAGTAVITALAGDASGQAVVTFRPGPPAALDLTANPNRLPADGESMARLTALVSDNLGNNVADGVAVDFGTTAGTFEGGGSSYATTTRGGQAEANLRAPLSVGATVVTARTGIFEHSVEIEFVSAPPYTVTLEASPRKLPADGVSTAVLTATVRDRQNRPVEDGTPAVFEVDHGRLGVGQAITVATSSGIATTTLIAPQGPARARARVTAGDKWAETEVSFIGRLLMPEIMKRSRPR